MKYFLAIILIFSSLAFAGTPRGAFIKDHRLARLAAAPDDKYKAAMAADGYTYVDAANIIGINEGDTCAKCDGTDFVASPADADAQP